VARSLPGTRPEHRRSLKAPARPGLSLYSLCIGRHRTRRQAVLFFGRSRGGHDAPHPLRRDNSRPVDSTAAGRGAYALASRWKVRPSFCVPGALPVLIASSEGAVRRDSRPSRRAINFNSWSAPIMVSRSTQASMVRAFFMATSNTCVRLSIIASPRSFDDGRQRANPGDGSDKDGGWFAAAGQGIRNAGDSAPTKGLQP
jgi:hypothetical protein